MKIGVLTFHEGLNHGAYLQAYATMRVLEEMGHCVTLINYKNREHWLEEDVHPWKVYRRPIRFIDRFKKIKAFKADHKLFKLTPFTKDPKVVQRLGFDVVVVGSDVVWNYKIFGFDKLYFGHLPAKRTIAYAPSFGWVNFGDQHPAGVAEGIQSFDVLSVRDDNTRRIVESITGVSAVTVLDPTLIYDFSKDEVITPRIQKLGKYMLVYAYVSDPDVISGVQKYAREHGLKLVSLGYRQPWCDKVYMDVGPMEWLGFYRHASAVATSTFHGTIFALKYKKEFFYIKNEKAQNRVVSLADSCGLTDAFFGSDDPMAFVQPDHEDVQRHLKPLADASRNWLEQALVENGLG